MNICQIVLKPHEEERIKAGHPWVFSNEVNSFSGIIKSGELADVFSYQNEFIGRGFLNTNSKIIVRILTRYQEQIDYDFFYQRIYNCYQYRLSLGYDNNYRLVFGESDYLPGLIIDKYGDYLACQFLSLGMDNIKKIVIDILISLFKPKGIIERSDVKVRQKEGLEEVKQVLYGDIPDVVQIIENEIKINLDLNNGQKTGYFLDQKENRNNLQYFVKNKKVLDCFSYIGGFALHACKYQAREVIAVDVSNKACEQIKINANINDFNINIIQDNVFDLLKKYQEENNFFDCIILDPPAFTKSNDKIKEAYRGYRNINSAAMKIINNGGFLISCSCTKFMTPSLFLEMLQEASLKANCSSRLVEFRTQAKDHPSLLGSDESLYLKCVILQINR